MEQRGPSKYSSWDAPFKVHPGRTTAPINSIAQHASPSASARVVAQDIASAHTLIPPRRGTGAAAFLEESEALLRTVTNEAQLGVGIVHRGRGISSSMPHMLESCNYRQLRSWVSRLRRCSFRFVTRLDYAFAKVRACSIFFRIDPLAFVSEGLNLKANTRPLTAQDLMSRCSTILFAEDDENDAFLFLTALSKAGVNNPVVHVLNGEEALSYLAGIGAYSDRMTYPFPCLLVTDLKMPRLSGFDLLARARPILDSNHLTALVLSASVAEVDRERSLQLGAQGYFVKPPDLNGLVAFAKEIKHSWLAPATLPT